MGYTFYTRVVISHGFNFNTRRAEKNDKKENIVMIFIFFFLCEHR